MHTEKRRGLSNPLTTSRMPFPHWGPRPVGRTRSSSPLAKRISVDLNLGSTMFQNVGILAEKALLLSPASLNSWTDGVQSMPLLLVWGGLTYWSEPFPQITLTHARKGLR